MTATKKPLRDALMPKGKPHYLGTPPQPRPEPVRLDDAYVVITIVSRDNADAYIHAYGPYTSSQARQEMKKLEQQARDEGYYSRFAAYVRKVQGP